MVPQVVELEDCFMGYDLEDGTNDLLSPSLPLVLSTYGAGAFDVVEGSTTLFPDNSYSLQSLTSLTIVLLQTLLAGLGASTQLITVVTKSCTAMYRR